MAQEIKLPELGEGLEAGDIIDLKVAAGATVTKGQALLELEAEKSTVEVPSPLDGRITEVRVKKGDRLKVGQTICFIEDGEAGDKAGKPEKSESPREEKPAPKETPPESSTKTEKPAAAPRDGQRSEPDKP